MGPTCPTCHPPLSLLPPPSPPFSISPSFSSCVRRGVRIGGNDGGQGPEPPSFSFAIPRSSTTTTTFTYRRRDAQPELKLNETRSLSWQAHVLSQHLEPVSPVSPSPQKPPRRREFHRTHEMNKKKEEGLGGEAPPGTSFFSKSPGREEGKH